MIKYSLIFACTKNGGIGYKNKLPWNIKEDIQLFKYITSFVKNNTKKNVIIMGSNTWKSIHNKSLPDRINIVLSSEADELNKKHNIRNLFFFDTFNNAIHYCNSIISTIEKVFIIGGADFINYIMDNEYHKSYIDNIYLSLIYKNYECDKFINLKNILKNYYVHYNDVYFYKDFLHLTAYNKI